MKLMSVPRRLYTNGNTPIQRLDRLSSYLGGPQIYMKRDDLTGLAAGGNKTRKLEFLVADALAKGCDTLVTTGAVQSNHCRLTLAAAAHEGMKCRLVLREVAPKAFSSNGNMLLFDLLGVESVTRAAGEEDADRAMVDIEAALRAEGRRGYVIPVGGSNPLGALGYAICALEILSQSLDAGIRFDGLVCANGSGGTLAGLLAGLWAVGANVPVTGINISRPAADRDPIVHAIASQALKMMGVPAPLPNGLVRTFDEWIVPGYALPSDAMIEAVRLVGGLEGILLDPVYSGKAMAGLIGLIRRGELGRGQNVLFIHTGGIPAIYAYRRAFQGR